MASCGSYNQGKRAALSVSERIMRSYDFGFVNLPTTVAVVYIITPRGEDRMSGCFLTLIGVGVSTG